MDERFLYRGGFNGFFMCSGPYPGLMDISVCCFGGLLLWLIFYLLESRLLVNHTQPPRSDLIVFHCNMEGRKSTEKIISRPVLNNNNNK